MSVLSRKLLSLSPSNSKVLVQRCVGYVVPSKLSHIVASHKTNCLKQCETFHSINQCCPNDLSSPLYKLARRQYASKQDISEHGIVFKRPEYVPSWRPENSGDMKPLELPEKSRPVVELHVIKDEISKADETTQRLLSVEFGSSGHAVQLAKYDKVRQIQRHFRDFGSLEVQIAKMTTSIRRMQQKLPTIYRRKPKIRTKVRLDNKIALRRRYLKVLAQYDYKKFEWLLEQLDLQYKPYNSPLEPVERKRSLRKLVQMHCKEIMQKKLDAYQAELESQKEAFLKEKQATLKWIEEVEQKYNIKQEPPKKKEIKGRFRNLIISPKAMKDYSSTA